MYCRGFRYLDGFAPPGDQRNRQPLYADAMVNACQYELGGAVRHGGGHRCGSVAQSLAGSVGDGAGGNRYLLPGVRPRHAADAGFSVELGWLPTVGADSWRHYILPSLTLGAAVASVMARFTRASFVDVLHEDYMRTARAKGVSETLVVLKHGLRNAMIPVVTMMGLQFGFLLGGSIVVEGLQLVGAWPVAGRFRGDARLPGDSGGSAAVFAGVHFINLVVDVMYAAINPAIRYK